jgi:hypothetical protein
VVVHRVAARLHDENIGAAHIFENLKINLSIAKAAKLRFAERNIQMLADAFCKGQIRGARENFKAVVVQEAFAPMRQRENIAASKCNG